MFPAQYTSLSTIWPQLQPYLKTYKIQNILKNIYEDVRSLYIKGEYSSREAFIQTDDAKMDDLLSLNKPWEKYPLIYISPVENLTSVKNHYNKQIKNIEEKNYTRWTKETLEENWKEAVRDNEEIQGIIRLNAKLENDSYLWYVLSHMCDVINALFLATLMQLAFGKDIIKVIHSSLGHYWIYKTDTKENFDLTYPDYWLDKDNNKIYREDLTYWLNGKITIYDNPIIPECFSSDLLNENNLFSDFMYIIESYL